MPSPVLEEGKTAWQIARANNARILIDAAAYYNAFMQTARLAERSIMILGWDMDSRLMLNREASMSPKQRQKSGAPEPLEGEPVQLLTFLNQLLEEKPELKIYMLNWDYSVIYALEREAMAQIKVFWEANERLEFQFDSNHPLGASHHQKVAVIDDSVAFAGGIDLTGQRWDTPRHLPEEPGRHRPDGERYDSFHDIQFMVSGQAARCLGELARNRWMRATGNIPAPPPARDIWPEAVEPWFEDVNVGIIRTDPAFEGRQEVRESEDFLKAAIRSASNYIYIENQYLTSTAIGDTICEMLEKPDGPEVVIVTPRECPGWLEEATMGVLRHRVVKSLHESDLYGRLFLYYPSNEGNDIFVHAKTLIVDNRLAFVGSTNLSNRSMGLDTECSIALDSALIEGENKSGGAKQHQLEDAIENYLCALVAEHLGQDEAAVKKSLQQDSLAGTIARFRGGKRSLVPLKTKTEPLLDTVIPQEQVDPEKPIQIEKVLSDILPMEP